MPAPSARSKPPAETAAATEPAPRRARTRGNYASDLMLMRRRSVLKAAMELISERGAEGFTIRQLSERAKVSVTMIYATYGDKEGLLATAILDYYDHLTVAAIPAPRTLAEVLAAGDAANAAVITNKGYAREYVRLHFSNTADARIQAAIRKTINTSGGKLQWLEHVGRAGDILEGIPLELIEATLVNLRFGLLHEWVQGRVSDDALAAESRLRFLIFVRSIATGATLRDVEAELRRTLRRHAKRPAPTGAATPTKAAGRRRRTVSEG